MQRGIPEEAIKIILASVADSTIKQYSCALKQWTDFCIRSDVDFANPSIANVLSFLMERFDIGAAYGTLNSFRSAISLVSRDKIGGHIDISRFMKGAYRLRPARPKYAHTWDVAIVLDYLEVLDCTDLDSLILKTLLLLALSTAQRAQTLSLIKLSNFTEVGRGLEIRIPELMKTSAAGREQPLLQVPKFYEKPNLCVVKSINDYIKFTKDLRKNKDELFLSIRAPHNPVGADTISRWLKKGLI